MRKIKKDGFTLVESILAAGILAFVVCSLLFLFVTCMFLNDASRNSAVAISHAQYLMEDMKNNLMASGSISNFGSLVDSGNWDLNNSEAVSVFGGAALPDEYIDTSATETDANSLDVEVTVYWHDRRPRDRSFSLETIFTQP